MKRYAVALLSLSVIAIVTSLAIYLLPDSDQDSFAKSHPGGLAMHPSTAASDLGDMARTSAVTASGGASANFDDHSKKLSILSRPDRSVENWGERIRSGGVSSTTNELREALSMISICRSFPDIARSFSDRAAVVVTEPTKFKAVADSIHQLEAACQTIDPQTFSNAETLALRYFESGSRGAAALLSREYPEAAARVPRSELLAALLADSYAGDQSSISYLAVNGRSWGLPLDELIGFQLALSVVTDDAAPAAGGRFESMLREAVGTIRPEAMRISKTLIDAMRSQRARDGSRAD